MKRARTPQVTEFYDALREAERRAMRTDVMYLAKWMMGRAWVAGAKGELTKNDGWCFHHRKLSDDLRSLWGSRQTRPYKTFYNLVWPRGSRKTTVVHAFVIQVLLNEPNTRILIDSDNVENAWSMLSPIKQVFESEYFIELFGDMRGPKDWSAKSITVKRTATHKESSITCSGLNSEKTSQHYELIISDDTQTKGNSDTVEQIKGVVDNFKLYESLLDKGGMAVLPGTRWNFKDLGQHIIDMEHDDIRCGRPKRVWSNVLSCYKPDAEGVTAEKNGLEFPDILDKETLAFARINQGPFMFSCNYLCKPQSDETAVFKKEWIRYHDLSDSELEQMQARFYLCVDVAGEGKFKGADWNVVAVVAITPKFDIYVVDYHRFHGTRQQLFDSVVERNARYVPRAVGIEQVFQQNELASWMKSQALEKRVRIPWHRFKRSGMKKEHRIMSLQPYAENGKFFIRPTHVELEQEMIRFPRGDHDDVLDAVAYGEEFMLAPIASQPKEFWRSKDWAEKIEEQNKVLPDSEKKVVPSSATVRCWNWMNRKNEPRGKILHLLRVR